MYAAICKEQIVNKTPPLLAHATAFLADIVIPVLDLDGFGFSLEVLATLRRLAGQDIVVAGEAAVRIESIPVIVGVAGNDEGVVPEGECERLMPAIAPDRVVLGGNGDRTIGQRPDRRLLADDAAGLGAPPYLVGRGGCQLEQRMFLVTEINIDADRIVGPDRSVGLTPAMQGPACRPCSSRRLRRR
ncbi:hypothetical protein [Rhizobium mayense]|uniref:hypothetical protein n=1 Tax=Rhizobium mayense TaxID=1312184 RepID=UPI0032E4CBDC